MLRSKLEKAIGEMESKALDDALNEICDKSLEKEQRKGKGAKRSGAKWLLVAAAAVLVAAMAAIPLAAVLLPKPEQELPPIVESTAKESESESGAETLGGETKTEETPATPSEPTASPETEPYPIYAGRFSDFDSDLMAFIEESESGNYMVSPLSLKSVLGMLLAGARGDTRAQMLQALGLENEEALEDLLKEYRLFEKNFAVYSDAVSRAQKQDETAKGALKSANAVWKRDDTGDWTKEYKQCIKEYRAESGEFTGKDLIGKVNEWCDGNTNHLIPRLLPDDYDTSDTVIVFLNALYYKNGWDGIFRKMEQQKLFTTLSGEKVPKDFINGSGTAKYYCDDETEIVAMPMQNGVDMVLVTGSTEELEAKLKAAKETTVHLQMPTFKMETSLDERQLCRFMQQRGMIDAFTPTKADFSGIVEGNAPIYVDDVIQKTTISLDEKGVEAAAVTMIGAKLGGINPRVVSVTLDRPFHFYITAKTAKSPDQPGVILFEGRFAE